MYNRLAENTEEEGAQLCDAPPTITPEPKTADVEEIVDTRKQWEETFAKIMARSVHARQQAKEASAK